MTVVPKSLKKAKEERSRASELKSESLHNKMRFILYLCLVIVTYASFESLNFSENRVIDHSVSKLLIVANSNSIVVIQIRPCRLRGIKINRFYNYRNRKAFITYG